MFCFLGFSLECYIRNLVSIPRLLQLLSHHLPGNLLAAAGGGAHDGDGEGVLDHKQAGPRYHWSDTVHQIRQ